MCTLVYSMLQKKQSPIKIDQLMDIHQRTFRLDSLDFRNDGGVLLDVLKEEDDDSCMDDSW